MERPWYEGMLSMFRQSLPGHALSVEEGTAAVPNDGCYYVLFNGEQVARYRTRRGALARYSKIKATLPIERHQSKVTLDEIREREMGAMSNKELIWGDEDFARVERMTRRRPKHGGRRG